MEKLAKRSKKFGNMGENWKSMVKNGESLGTWKT